MTVGTHSNAYILFQVAGTTYALPSDDVRHMEMIDQITPVPNASPYLEGVVFSRGQIVPVLNLRSRFGYERAPHDASTRLLIVQSSDRWVGLLADSAREFVRIPAAAIQPPSHAMATLSADYLRGIASLDGRLVLVLDIGAVLEASLANGDPPDAADAPADAADRHQETAL